MALTMARGKYLSLEEARKRHAAGLSDIATARELGLTLPPAIMIQATEFIE